MHLSPAELEILAQGTHQAPRLLETILRAIGNTMAIAELGVALATIVVIAKADLDDSLSVVLALLAIVALVLFAPNLTSILP